MNVRFVCGWLVGWVEVFRRVSGGEGSIGKGLPQRDALLPGRV